MGEGKGRGGEVREVGRVRGRGRVGWEELAELDGEERVDLGTEFCGGVGC